MIKALIDFIKRGFRGSLLIIGGNQALATNPLLRKSGQLSLNSCLLLKQPGTAGSDQGRHPQRQRCDQNNRQRNHRMDGKHKTQRPHDGDYPGKQLGKSLQQTIGNHIDVIDQRIHKISLLRAVQSRQRQRVKLPEALYAQIPNRPIAAGIGAQRHQPLKDRRENENEN